METKTKQENVDKQVTSSHREERLVVPLPDGAAIPWIIGIRAMVRDRQYEVTQMMDDLDPKKCPIENEAWQRVKHELETVADLCNRMIYRINCGETGSRHNVRPLAPADTQTPTQNGHS